MVRKLLIYIYKIIKRKFVWSTLIKQYVTQTISRESIYYPSVIIRRYVIPQYGIKITVTQLWSQLRKRLPCKSY